MVKSERVGSCLSVTSPRAADLNLLTSVQERTVDSEEHLVRLNLSLLIQKLRREEDGKAFFEVNHNACGQPF
jgi:hypothetical protein